MAIFRQDDLPGFLTDFGETAILEGGSEITVIFDNEYSAATLFERDVESSAPTAMGLTSDLEDVVHDSTIEIREITYRVIGIQPDGQGMTVLILAR
jgi:hypothetical protein